MKGTLLTWETNLHQSGPSALQKLIRTLGQEFSPAPQQGNA